ncbi:MAG: hypothetical protein ACK4VN_13095 [Bacteroidales bacterium]
MAKTAAKKLFMIISAIALILLLVAVVFSRYFLPQIITTAVQKNLQTQFDKQSSDLYEIKVTRVAFKLNPPCIVFPSITITPRLQDMGAIALETLPKNIISVRADNLRLSPTALFSLARKKQHRTLARIHLGFLDLKISQNPASLDTLPSPSAPEKSWSIRCDDFSIARAFIQYGLLSDTIENIFFADKISVATSIIVKQEEYDDKPRFEFPAISLHTGSLGFTPTNSLYKYSSDGISFDGRASTLTASNLKITPLYDEHEFQNHITHQTDMANVLIKRVTFSGLEIHNLINKNTLSCYHISVEGGEADIFRDRSLTLDLQRRPLMPVRRIQEAPFFLDIATLSLENYSIIYSERPENKTTKGYVDFRELSATLRNISNLPEKLQNDSLMTIEARAQIFGNALLKAGFVYNLKDSSGGFTAKGELERLNFSAINPALVPLTGIKIEAGTHHHSLFQFSGNDFHASGTLQMRYQGLTLEMEPSRSQIRRNIVGWLGRNLVYHPHNPATNNNLRIGTIDFERDPSRFVFHYWWNAYLTGIKHTVLRDSASAIISN